MSTAPSTETIIPTAVGRTPLLPPRLRRRRRGWAVLALLLGGLTLFEAVTHGGWVGVAAVVGIIGPDLTFLAAIGAPIEPGLMPRRVVRPYNVAHHPLTALIPLLLLAVFGGPLAGSQTGPVLFTFLMAWLTHIAFDRAMGYGPRAADGSFRDGFGPAHARRP